MRVFGWQKETWGGFRVTGNGDNDPAPIQARYTRLALLTRKPGWSPQGNFRNGIGAFRTGRLAVESQAQAAPQLKLSPRGV